MTHRSSTRFFFTSGLCNGERRLREQIDMKAPRMKADGHGFGVTDVLTAPCPGQPANCNLLYGTWAW